VPYLIDSDIVIAHLKDDKEVLALIDRLSEGPISISVITYMEAYQGVIRSPEPHTANHKFNAFMASVPAFPVSVEVAQRCAGVREGLRQSGRSYRSRSLDLLIAATAMEYELTLVTRNTKHYDDIPGLQLYGFE
jgi:predicted nucleic acid-binding protein